MSVPVRDWTNEAVLEYRLLRWDYQILKKNDVPMADYDRTRDQFTRLNKGSKAETKTAHTANFLEQKRLLLTKLLELRAAAGQAMNEDLRAASAAITVAKEGVDKAQGELVKETLRHNKRMRKLLTEQAKHLDGIHEVAKVMEAAADAGEAALAPATDDEQIGADGEDQTIVIADGEEQLGAAAVACAAENLTVGGEEQEAEPEAVVASTVISKDVACPKGANVCRGVKKLATHQRKCKVLIDVEQLLGAHAPAEVNPAAAGKQQVPDGGIVPYVCGYCTRTFLDANILDKHERLCKAGAYKERSTDENIDSKFTCLVCSKGYITEFSLRSHKRHCKKPRDNKPGPASPVVLSRSAAPQTPAAPIDPMADKICQACCKMCRGTRGLASHRRTCQGQPDATSCPFGAGAAGSVACAADAEAPDSVNPAVVDREQAPDGYIDLEIPCSKRLKTFCNDRALRTHHRPSKKSAVDEVAPTDPLADQVCQTCSKICKGMHGLRSHRRACQKRTDAEEAAGPNVAGAAADGNAEVARVESKRRRRSKTKEKPEVSAQHDHQHGDGPAPTTIFSIPPCSSW